MKILATQLQMYFLDNKNDGLSVPLLLWPENCVKIGGHATSSNGSTVYSLYHCERFYLFGCCGAYYERVIFSTNFSRLSKNPYYCDCSFVWFLRENPYMKKHLLDLKEMTCAYPDKMHGQKVVDLKERDICNAGIYDIELLDQLKIYMCTTRDRTRQTTLTES